MIRALIAVAVSVTMVFAVRSEEPCQTVEQVSELVTKDGGTISGAAYYRGQVTDALLVVETPASIVIYGFKAGCLVAIMPIEAVEPMTPA